MSDVWGRELDFHPFGDEVSESLRLNSSTGDIPDVDFGETYAPVARLEAIRILLAYSCAHNIKLYQMDIKSAFLSGYINKEVYAEQPPGFEDDNKPDHVYKLKKALYGLKQTPRAWYEKLRDFLLSKGFMMGKVDTTLLLRRLAKTYLCCKSMLMTSYLDQPIKIFVKNLER